MRKNLTLAFFALFCALTAAAQLHNDDVHVHQAVSRQNYRQYLRIPDIGGYITLKCDFHVHSDISDGQVWPVGRVNEAWNDGLDAIAMTDHIEVHKNADIIRCGLNKPYELAKARGDMIGMIVIPGAEITRKKPLGHICTLFIRDADKLDVEDEMQAVEEACRQGAFLLWNHPGYPDRKSDIYPVHERLIAQGKLRGVEVFNKTESYPRAFDYAVQYGLVPFANSDIHYMSGSIYPVRGSRPMTLVFATARTAGAIREALLAGRALACFDGNLMGRGEYIGQMIDAARSRSPTSPTCVSPSVRPPTTIPCPSMRGRCCASTSHRARRSNSRTASSARAGITPAYSGNRAQGIRRRGSALRRAAATDTVFCYRSYI